jgi:hypothetical protein
MLEVGYPEFGSFMGEGPIFMGEGPIFFLKHGTIFSNTECPHYAKVSHGSLTRKISAAAKHQ